MSQESSNENTDQFTDSGVVNKLLSYRYAFAVFVVMVFMFAVRAQSYDKLVTSYGLVFPGNDPWYHFRTVMYTVNNWPAVLTFDPLSGYPNGASAGTFGTLYDQILATIALIIGLGNPSSQLVRQIMVFTPAVISSLITIPVYFMARHLTESRRAGLLSVGILALMPGVFLSRGLVGVADHNIAEPFFLMTAVYLLMRAIRISESAIVLPEVVREAAESQEFGEIRQWMIAVAAATIGLTAYLLVWPPSIMIFGLLGFSLGLYALLQYGGQFTAQPALLASAAMMTFLTVVALFTAQTFGFQTNRPSLLHAVFAGGAFLGFVALIFGERLANQYDISTAGYVGSVVGLSGLGSVLVWLFSPSAVSLVLGNVRRLLGIESGGAISTIGEEQALTVNQIIFSEYGLTIVVFAFALLGLLAQISRLYGNDEPFADRLFVLVVALFIAAISIRNARFNYYFAPVISVFTGYAVYHTIGYVGLPDSLSNVKGYQVIALIAIVSLLVPVLVAPVGSTVAARGDAISTQSYQDWHDTLDWMSDNTPEPDVEQYPQNVDTEDGDYDYAESDYGVMSWWDYGHWISVTGERIPVANPFQQHANEAAQYLLAEDAESAEREVSEMSDETNDIRYVAIDWKMVSPYSKFTAPVVFHDTFQPTDMYERYFIRQNGQLRLATLQPSQPYYDTLMVKLYKSHGSRMETGPYVINYEIEQTTSGQTVRLLDGQQPIKVFNSTEDAKSYADDRPTSAFGGVGTNPSEPVEALEHYRLVKSSDTNSFNRSGYRRPALRTNQLSNGTISPLEINSNPSTVKLFERVSGAQIDGSEAPPNSTVELSVQLFDTTTGQPFTYEQHAEVAADGTFSATVPYAGVEREQVDTNTAVQSLGQYQLQTVDGGHTGNVTVTEQDVVSEDRDPVTVELQTVGEQGSPQNTSEE